MVDWCLVAFGVYWLLVCLFWWVIVGVLLFDCWCLVGSGCLISVFCCGADWCCVLHTVFRGLGLISCGMDFV